MIANQKLRSWMARRFKQHFGPDEKQVHRGLLLFYSTFLVLLFSVSYLPYYHANDIEYGLYHCSLGVSMALVEFFILFRLRKLVFAGHFYCFCVVTFFAFSIYFTNGAYSPFVPWLVLAPIMGLLIFDMRAGIFWGAASFFTLLMFAALPDAALGPKADYMRAIDEITLIISTGFVSFMLVLVYFSDRTRLDLILLQRLIASDKQHQLTGLMQAMEGREMERQRISRELHDGVNANLTALRMQHETTLIQQNGNAHDLQKQIVHEISELSSTVSQLSRRMSVHLLRDFGLDEGIRHLALEIGDRYRCDIQVFINHKTHLPDDLHVPVYRMAQEVLEQAASQLPRGSLYMQLLRLDDLVRIMLEGDPHENETDPADTTRLNQQSLSEVNDCLNVLQGEMLMETDSRGRFSFLIEFSLKHEKDKIDPRG